RQLHLTAVPPGGARAQRSLQEVRRSRRLLHRLHPGGASDRRLADRRQPRRRRAGGEHHEPERAEVAGMCLTKLALELAALIDGADDRVERLYTGWPDRLYVIDRDGRVTYKSAAGPFGFRPSDVEAALVPLMAR